MNAEVEVKHKGKYKGKFRNITLSTIKKGT